MYIELSTIISVLALLASLTFGIYSQRIAKASKNIADQALKHSTSISWDVFTLTPKTETEPGKLTPPPFQEDILFCWHGIGSAPARQVELHFSHDPQSLNLSGNKIPSYNPAIDTWKVATSGISIFDFVNLKDNGGSVTINWIDVTDTRHSRTIKYSDMKQLDLDPTSLP